MNQFNTTESGIGNDIKQIFEDQVKTIKKSPFIPYKVRMSTLYKIEEILIENDETICDAIKRDFGNRSFQETRLLEITSCLTGLRYTRKKLNSWIKPQNRHVSALFTGAKNRVIPQPKGIVGIIVPWNYPLLLTISPLTSAIAAGNRVMIKMAANSQNLCRLLNDKFKEKVSKDLIRFLPGISADDFTQLPFHHLIFTGSPQVGKKVMKKAAQNLTPVTLELGGKSPVIIGNDFPLKTAVKRIMFAKLMNAGQTCIAPDYLFIHSKKIGPFIHLAQSVTSQKYKNLQSNHYTAIISSKAFIRLNSLLNDASEKGATLINLLNGEDSDPDLNKISPFILKNVHPDMQIMNQEIFGPVLPIIPYNTIDEVIDYINHRDRPLALYLFTNDPIIKKKVISQTVSGGVTINDCGLHAVQHDMPFGGIGNSGMGHYHGFEGFAELSKFKPVYTQSRLALPLKLPFDWKMEWVYKLIKKYKWLH